MSVSLVVNGVSYDFPEPNDTNWGQTVTNWATAVSTTTLQRSGGTFTLTAEVDWGATFGTKGAYWKSRTANPASAGAVRLARADTIGWRNQANSADLALGVNASNQFTFAGTALPQSVADTTTIDLTLSAGGELSAAIVAASVDTAQLKDGGVTNAKVNASAAIATTKLAALTANRVAVTNASGFLTDTGAATMNSTMTMGSGANVDLDGNNLIIDTAGNVSLSNSGGTSVPFQFRQSAVTLMRAVNSGQFYDFFWTDDTGNAGPAFRSFRVSTTPAANDDLGTIDFYGKDSAGNDQLYGQFVAKIDDPTSTTEDGHLRVNVTVAGASTNVAQFQPEGIRLPIQTASRACVFDANKAVTSSATTATELGYVNGVTSAIQTQLDAKALQTESMRLLATYSPSAAASVDVTSVFSGTYARYKVVYELTPATDDVEFWIRTDTSNGASFDAVAGDYRWGLTGFDSAGAAITYGGNTAEIRIGSATATRSVGNAAGEGVSGEFIVFTGSATRFPTISGTGWLVPANGVSYSFAAGGARQSAATINAIQLLFESGNIASGTVKVYGLP